VKIQSRCGFDSFESTRICGAAPQNMLKHTAATFQVNSGYQVQAFGGKFKQKGSQKNKKEKKKKSG
jgi:hypothetical protein